MARYGKQAQECLDNLYSQNFNCENLVPHLTGKYTYMP